MNHKSKKISIIGTVAISAFLVGCNPAVSSSDTSVSSLTSTAVASTPASSLGSSSSSSPVSSEAVLFHVIVIDGSGSGDYAENESVTVTAEEKEGEAFVAWTIDGAVVSTDATYTFTATGSVTITAEYETIVYTATFVADGVVVDTREFTKDTESLEEPSVPEKTGHTGSWESYSLGCGDIEIHAVYEANSYPITVVSEHATVIVDEEASYNETVRLEVQEISGYRITAVTINGEPLEGDSFVMPDEAVTVSVETEACDTITAIPESAYFDALAISSLVDTPSSIEETIAIGDITLVASSAAKMRVYNEAKAYAGSDGHVYTGLINTWGPSDIRSGRYFMIRPLQNMRFVADMFAPSGVSEETPVYLLSALAEPSEQTIVAQTNVLGGGSSFSAKLECDLEKGETYYFYTGCNLYVCMSAVYTEEVTVNVRSLEVDASSARTEFTVGEEFSAEGLKAFVLDDDGLQYACSDFDVDAPDMESAGEKEVTVRYGDYTEQTYTISVLEGAIADTFTYSTAYYDALDIKNALDLAATATSFNQDVSIGDVTYVCGGQTMQISADARTNGGHVYNGDFKLAGASNLSGRYLRFTLPCKATVNLYLIVPSSVGSATGYLLNSLAEPGDANTEAAFSVTTSNTLFSAELEAGTYYFWGSANIWSRGFNIAYSEPQTCAIESLKIDAGNAKTTYVLGEEFSYENLIVYAKLKNNKYEKVTDFTVSAPDMETAGTKEVTVRYGDVTVGTYEIEVA